MNDKDDPTVGSMLSDFFYPTPEAKAEARKRLREQQSRAVWQRAWKHAVDKGLYDPVAFADHALGAFWEGPSEQTEEVKHVWRTFYLDCFDGIEALVAARAYVERFGRVEVEA